jgi:hypothetical protein
MYIGRPRYLYLPSRHVLYDRTVLDPRTGRPYAYRLGEFAKKGSSEMAARAALNRSAPEGVEYVGVYNDPYRPEGIKVPDQFKFVRNSKGRLVDIVRNETITIEGKNPATIGRRIEGKLRSRQIQSGDEVTVVVPEGTSEEFVRTSVEGAFGKTEVSAIIAFEEGASGVRPFVNAEVAATVGPRWGSWLTGEGASAALGVLGTASLVVHVWRHGWSVCPEGYTLRIGNGVECKAMEFA